jgi:hypothetical protein
MVLDGEYSLVRLNGQPLPFDLGPLPPRPRSSTLTECRERLTSGLLRVSRAQGAFELTYETRVSCDNRLLGTAGSFGSYRQNGAQLVLTADLGGGRSEDYAGKVRGSEIDVAGRFFDFTFKR